MTLPAGTTFALTNRGTKAYFGTYQGNPFTNVYRLSVFQLDD
jgi:hypothetical protein